MPISSVALALEGTITCTYNYSVSAGFYKSRGWTAKGKTIDEMSPQKIIFKDWKPDTSGNMGKVTAVHPDRSWQGIFTDMRDFTTIFRNGAGGGNPYWVTYAIFHDGRASIKSRHYQTLVAPNTETWWGSCRQ